MTLEWISYPKHFQTKSNHFLWNASERRHIDSILRMLMHQSNSSHHADHHHRHRVSRCLFMAWCFSRAGIAINLEMLSPGPTFINPDQLDPWIKDQLIITLLSIISLLQLPNFVSCGRACPSHMTQNLVTVGTKLWTAERFLVDPWSTDQADLVW